MEEDLGVDSLRYLPVQDLGRVIGCEQESLCTGCVTGKYPTGWGNRLLRIARQNSAKGITSRAYGA